jgi:PEP-CTERM motif
MKSNRLVPLLLAVVTLSISPAHAASSFLLDFEKSWAYGTEVTNYYNGGTASDSTSGSNFGVSFNTTLDSAMFGLSNNDGLGSLPNGDYYANAPSMLGVASPFGPTVFMNVNNGVDSTLSFYYTSAEAITGAVKAYSGLNGTGSLLGSFNLLANNAGTYDTWSQATFNFAGTAQSFDFSASSNIAGFDNIAAVPEPETYAMLLAGLGLMAFAARRKNKQNA